MVDDDVKAWTFLENASVWLLGKTDSFENYDVKRVVEFTTESVSCFIVKLIMEKAKQLTMLHHECAVRNFS